MESKIYEQLRESLHNRILIKNIFVREKKKKNAGQNIMLGQTKLMSWSLDFPTLII